ncbi:MAG: hypothetical protein HYZ14_06510 [Bacteroidetes bacterium]|nr:hypothetical protein [Bacteroidota bacterium]
MQPKEIFVTILCIGGGIFVILASTYNWNFFFENRKARIFLALFGRTGARIFYIIVGFFLFFCAYKIITG